MERVLTVIVALVVVVALGLNLFLFAQNQDLRRRIAAIPPTPPAPSQDQIAKLQELTSELDQYKKDFSKISAEVRKLREQDAGLASAATERDALKVQVEQLHAENTQLKNQVLNLQTMNGINGQVATLRGLSPRATVPRTFMNQAQLHDYFTASFEKDYTPAAETQERTVLRALDMDSGEPSLRAAQIDALTRSVLGFYSQENKQLVVVTNRPQMGVKDRITYAHEFTHSLQDQYYDLTALFKQATSNSDRRAAIQALVEGDATLTMSLYAQKYLDAIDKVNYRLELMSDLDPYSAFANRGGPMTESATYFPYQEGESFVADMYGLGGWKQVDAMFARPPRSTEQVLHPEKFVAGDEPVAVALPNLAAALDGWNLVAEDTLGELYTRIYLEHALPLETAIPAGEGWGGDRYQVLQDGQGHTALALRSAWDSPEDASEFFAAYSKFVLKIGGSDISVLHADADHARWQLAGRQVYLSRVGSQVLVLHAADGPTLDRMLAQFRGM